MADTNASSKIIKRTSGIVSSVGFCFFIFYLLRKHAVKLQNILYTLRQKYITQKNAVEHLIQEVHKLTLLANIQRKGIEKNIDDSKTTKFNETSQKLQNMHIAKDALFTSSIAEFKTMGQEIKTGLHVELDFNKLMHQESSKLKEIISYIRNLKGITLAKLFKEKD